MPAYTFEEFKAYKYSRVRYYLIQAAKANRHGNHWRAVWCLNMCATIRASIRQSFFSYRGG